MTKNIIRILLIGALLSLVGCKSCPDSWNLTYYQPQDGNNAKEAQIGIGISGPLPWAPK